MRHCSYALCALNITFNIFLKLLKHKAMHQCDLFSQEELNIENVLPLFKMLSLFYNHDIDQWHAGIGLIMEKSMFQLRYLTLIFVYSQYVKTYSHLFIAFISSFFCFYCATGMLNPIQDERKIKSLLFLVVTGM